MTVADTNYVLSCSLMKDFYTISNIILKICQVQLEFDSDLKFSAPLSRMLNISIAVYDWFQGH